jgi:hypothetical protein
MEETTWKRRQRLEDILKIDVRLCTAFSLIRI